MVRKLEKWRLRIGAALVTLGLLLNGYRPAAAQEVPTTLIEDFQGWFQLITQGTISGPLKGYFELQPRFRDDIGALDRILIRPAVYFNVSPTSTLWFGLAIVPAFQTNGTFTETRFWQQFQNVAKAGDLLITNRSRLEERLVPNTDGTSIRLRHLLRLEYPFDAAKLWSLIVADEIFFNLNDVRSLPAGLDQNRAFAGFGNRLTPALKLEFGYMANFVNRPELPDRLNHNLVVTLLYNFDAR
ncbi:DUF2490 domain-containing protein [Gloeobacter kilaueensis]|uniref:DUF2490 domain-containing protein n=1 Tax=Gloeobacter kilaueensis (strain ATCC BAA-2537 / CCAP 1431/1 / ULC 316 / JS1) TaxID=1183438 RepID=U5QJJ8_GLOK1|nr:DUF2490 domain-containing protein [Gloeobacter kilaueensis]AGY59167.1 hypothetical protein GKIL_2921 [Gloeobacter kilaueensis JS1]